MQTCFTHLDVSIVTNSMSLSMSLGCLTNITTSATITRPPK